MSVALPGLVPEPAEIEPLRLNAEDGAFAKLKSAKPVIVPELKVNPPTAARGFEFVSEPERLNAKVEFGRETALGCKSMVPLPVPFPSYSLMSPWAASVRARANIKGKFPLLVVTLRVIVPVPSGLIV
jgi:hypothetical protein